MSLVLAAPAAFGQQAQADFAAVQQAQAEAQQSGRSRAPSLSPAMRGAHLLELGRARNCAWAQEGGMPPGSADFDQLADSASAGPLVRPGRRRVAGRVDRR